MADHWYTRDGAPCYEQATQKGGLRNTDLRDARKLGLVPSVTTVLSVIDKPALTSWKVDQGIMAALTLPKLDGEADKEYLARIKADSGQQAKNAAEEGTKIHDAIEAHFKGKPVPDRYGSHVAAVVVELARIFPGVTDWVAEKSFGSPLGYGGKVDLHSPSTGITVDHKGKDGDFTDGKKLAYDQHWQLAPYQAGLGFAHSPAANIFVSRTHPGSVTSHVWTPEEMAHGMEVFMAALGLWKAIKRFDPSF
jgi:hypothetical protein